MPQAAEALFTRCPVYAGYFRSIGTSGLMSGPKNLMTASGSEPVFTTSSGFVARALLARGYTSPFCVEQDTHIRDPLLDLRTCRDYLAACGI